ncbi:hepatic sodium/bile acid cotransporter-like [Brachionichthys hirsutus]|uniref:hepatic sodium/bile acid cotransporter-like n=1 Tax=Brachionichthys hirsutus TaxID=412623 RepID=UPI003604E9F1
MEDGSDLRAVSDPGRWQNESLWSNTTDANATSVHGVMMPPAINKAINIILPVSLAVAMVSLGCTMELPKIKHHLMKPKGVAIALLAQYGVMPLSAFCLAKVFGLTEIDAVVVLICGCSPGGSLSNILALLLQGDMNLSIVMTSCSTLLALGMMPLLLYVYCQGFADLQRFVPYLDIVVGLILILIPCSIGILINHYRPQNAKIFKRLSIFIMMVVVVVVAVLTSIGIGGSILTVLSPTFTAISALMPLIGYSFGYAISSVFRLQHAERRTIAMETGCQNVQLCITILKLAFAPATVGPLFLFPMVYASFQLMEAAALMVLLRCYRRLRPKAKGKTGGRLKRGQRGANEPLTSSAPTS